MAALEWDDWRRSLCRDCHNPLAESAGEGPEAQEYEAVDYVCFACQTVAGRKAEIEADGGAATHGRKVGVRPVGPLKPPEEVG